MMRRSRLRSMVLFTALVFLPGPARHAFSQERPAHSPNVHSQYEKMDAPETNSEEEGYRHSKSVQVLARVMHIKTETAAQIFEDLNSAIIWGAIFWFLFKTLPGVFRKRSETIRKDLAEAHSVTEEARERLTAVEARLAKLDSEIETIRKQAEHESAEDEKRIRAALEEERRRIVESAEQEIAAFGAAAQRDLKRFAADLAVDRALQRIHLGVDADRILVENFTAGLAGAQGKGGQN